MALTFSFQPKMHLKAYATDSGGLKLSLYCDQQHVGDLLLDVDSFSFDALLLTPSEALFTKAQAEHLGGNAA